MYSDTSWFHFEARSELLVEAVHAVCLTKVDLSEGMPDLLHQQIVDQDNFLELENHEHRSFVLLGALVVLNYPLAYLISVLPSELPHLFPQFLNVFESQLIVKVDEAELAKALEVGPNVLLDVGNVALHKLVVGQILCLQLACLQTVLNGFVKVVSVERTHFFGHQAHQLVHQRRIIFVNDLVGVEFDRGRLHHFDELGKEFGETNREVRDSLKLLLDHQVVVKFGGKLKLQFWGKV